MTRTRKLDPHIEVGWALSAVEAARRLVELGEGAPDEAVRICTEAHALLRLVADQLRHIAQRLNDDGALHQTTKGRR